MTSGRAPAPQASALGSSMRTDISMGGKFINFQNGLHDYIYKYINFNLKHDLWPKMVLHFVCLDTQFHSSCLLHPP